MREETEGEQKRMEEANGPGSLVPVSFTFLSFATSVPFAHGGSK